MPLLIATSNRGKLREFQEILGAQFADLLIPADAGLQLDVAETGSSYAENAALKAQAYCQASGLACIADDSGLEVDALDGAPGLYSARFGAGQVSGDGGRRAYLLEKLAGCPQPQGAPGWPAHFHCTVAVAVPGQALRTFDGRCEGYILREERGQNGFGYDPYFFYPPLNRSFAELSAEEKNSVSHRKRALEALLKKLHQEA